ncbi:hypothetical protein QQS21_009904 [Conoideocrella luteorostrata]|uniref:Peptidase S8/S53 domain-containing protein n=1 Tax=Conoideocrella luteorostrata TaxID=1105319 RepID=A0AAJ0CG11_9HYPO|nr:hypothetical protein QQS21_009904 [Conoideocrella luteorostrata]
MSQIERDGPKLPRLDEPRRVLSALDNWIGELLNDPNLPELCIDRITHQGIVNFYRYYLPPSLDEETEVPGYPNRSESILLDQKITEAAFLFSALARNQDSEGVGSASNMTERDKNRLFGSNSLALYALFNNMQQENVSSKDVSAFLEFAVSTKGKSKLKDRSQIRKTRRELMIAARAKMETQCETLDETETQCETLDEMETQCETLEETETQWEIPESPGRRVRCHDLERAQKCLADLFSVLRNNISSECEPDHLAMLQIRYPEATDCNRRGIFISKCSTQDKWQEITCTVNPRSPESLEPLNISDFCKVVQQSCEPRRTLETSAFDSYIIRDPSAVPHAYPHLRTLSLYDILNHDGPTLKRYDRFALATNLSYTLLHAYLVGTPEEWTTRDILFLFDSSNNEIMEVYNPFLTFPLHQQQKPKPSDAVKFPLLTSLGRAILEIGLGHIVADLELGSDINHRLSAIMTNMQIKRLVIKNTGSLYYEALKCCLNISLHDIEGPGKPDEETTCLDALRSVIDNLEENRKADFSSDPFDLSKPNCPREIFVPGQRVQLYDDRDLLDASNKLCGHADDFFSRGQEFYTNNIKSLPNSLPNSRPIRIAILDTGIDVDKSFFRGIKMNREKRDSPFREIKSFVGDLGVDTYGHGTDVAASLLQMHPGADIYIGKISETKGHYGRDHLIHAIRWARECRVDLINISFGLLSDHDGIKREIELAEINGIIVCAAASNSGGNARRSFPARMDKVICVHASDGNGNKSGMDPAPKSDSDNFSTLGVGIESVWEPGVRKSGTSFSTPILVGIIANVLQYSGCLSDEHRRKVFSRAGMRSILRAMSVPSDGYRYVTPWRKFWDGESTTSDIKSKIKEALKDDT